MKKTRKVCASQHLRDLLVRLRKPDGGFDATMLLVADWDEVQLVPRDVKSAADVLSADASLKT